MRSPGNSSRTGLPVRPDAALDRVGAHLDRPIRGEDAGVEADRSRRPVCVRTRRTPPPGRRRSASGRAAPARWRSRSCRRCTSPRSRSEWRRRTRLRLIRREYRDVGSGRYATPIDGRDRLRAGIQARGVARGPGPRRSRTRTGTSKAQRQHDQREDDLLRDLPYRARGRTVARRRNPTANRNIRKKWT